VDEALALDPDIVSTACPFCLVMLTDSVNGKKASSDSGSATGGKAKESIQVVDVAQLLLESVTIRPAEAGPQPGEGTGTGAPAGREAVR
ncbi:hypothetical protein ACIQPQ_36860, partial [Streptomyces sp. NPDC091281]|uniref:hypothetical protein n=1 Tax=Streptomyces sp. NPDC091281 TaxID=3365985 RepID=UPI00380155A6